MIKEITFAEQILQFNKMLSNELPEVPTGYRLINPFKGEQEDLIRKLNVKFYEKYYSDLHPRRLILGSSPARRGSALTGIPFEDARHLQLETGIIINSKFHANVSSSDFLRDVISQYGGVEKFYAKFYMNFVCPFGIVKINEKGKCINCNYYENKKLQNALYPFIINMIRRQLEFRIDTSVCYCIGSGENYSFLSKLNSEYKFFGKIIPLEHPRYIMQYNLKDKDQYIKKYLDAFEKG